MSDYAGAVGALKAAFIAGWSAQTPIAYQNETPNVAGVAIDPWPPTTPWVYFEVLGNGSEIRGAGLAGDNIWLYRGHVFIHVFTPEGYGVETGQSLAVAAGEIFRAKTFYNDGQGSKVLCMSPATDGGASDADNGNWFRVTCSIPFEYFHRG